MSFLSKNSGIQNQELLIQEVSIRFSDLGLYSASGSVVTVNFQQTPTIVSVLNMDNSGPTAIMIAASACVVTGTSAAITLGAPFAANDVLRIQFTV